MSNRDRLRLMIIGAHPDDPEFHAGGISTIYRRAGHTVLMVSVTDGRSGHYCLASSELADMRRSEAEAAANVIGASYQTWDYPDGSLQPTLDVRERIIHAIRTFEPDLVLTHRPNDYHPDHRAVGQAVQDASYMVTVPLIAPDTPALAKDPVVAYLPDLFTRPYPLVGDVVFDITQEMDTVTQMLACHKSQVFDFLPMNQGISDQVPTENSARMPWLRQWYTTLIRPRADRFRETLITQYGRERGERIECIEAFEISEYATPLDAAARARLFWFCDTLAD